MAGETQLSSADAPDVEESLSEAFIRVVLESKLRDRDKLKLVSLCRLLSLRAAKMSGRELRRARELAGLSRGQACELLRIRMPALENIETLGAESVDADTLVRMDEIYGLGMSEEAV